MTCNSQKVDTIRLYNFESEADKWRLKLLSNNTFSLTSDFPFASNTKEIVLNGLCIKSDTTIQFICDTAKVKNKNLLADGLKQFSNIPAIGQGQIFRKEMNYFIPNHIIYPLDDSFIVPDNLFASYYRGDGFGSHILELKGDHTYKFTQHTCMDNSSEEGTWTESNNIITLTPPTKEWTMLDWVTSNRQLFVDANFLIGKKTFMTNKTTITETYFYLSKQALGHNTAGNKSITENAGLTEANRLH